MTPIILTTTIIPALALLAARLRPRRRLPIWTGLAVAIGTASLLLAPAVWAANTTTTVGSSIPAAGPSAQSSFGGGFAPGNFGGVKGGSFSGELPAWAGNGQPPAGAPSGSTSGQTSGTKATGSTSTTGTHSQSQSGFAGGSSSVDSQLLTYLLKNQGSAYYLLVTSTSDSAAPYIISTGKPVMSLGGFGGSDPILTLAQFQALAKNGEVKYVLGGGGQGGSSSIMQWVQTSCKAVSTSSSQSTGGGGFSQLYDCAGA